MGENFFLVGNTGDDVIRPRPRSLIQKKFKGSLGN